MVIPFMTKYFWQLSGNAGHIHYDWHTKIERIAEDVYDLFSIKDEEGTRFLDVVLGVEESGASHILMPSKWFSPKGRNPLPSINWKHGRSEPYPSSRYASLSPMRIDSALRLADLLQKRQNTAKTTSAGKRKTDTSKANARFLIGQPNLTRAAFEHSRCLWRILHDNLNPEDYGLSPAPWAKSLTIFSLVFNFWKPGGDIASDFLLNVALAKLPSKESGDAESTIFYFQIEETLMHRNPSEDEHANVPEIWQTRTVPKAQICQEVQTIIDRDSTIQGKLVTPVVILTYRYHSWLRGELSSLGLKNLEWEEDIAKLLGCVQSRRQYKEEAGSHHRARSLSPVTSPSSSIKLSRHIKRGDSPQPTQAPAIYVIDVGESFKAASGYELTCRTTPAQMLSKITGQHYPETGYAGHEADYILQAWKTLVGGPSVVDQNILFDGPAISADNRTTPLHRDQTETAEAPDLFVQTVNTQQVVAISSVYDESDSDDE